MYKIFKVKFELLENTYSYTGQSDVADIIMSKHFCLAHSVVITL